MLHDVNESRTTSTTSTTDTDVLELTGDRTADPRDADALRARVAALELEVETLRAGMESRQRIGFTTGVLGQRHGLQPDEAWRLLSHVSQQLNVKARRVAEVLLDAYCGRLAPEDVALAARITDLLPTPEH